MKPMKSKRTDQAMITYDHADIRYGGRLAAGDIDFSVQPGEIVGIVGESGSGKSTVIKAAMSILGPGGAVSEGHIWFQGYDMARIGRKELQKLCGPEIAMVFPDAGLYWCPVRTIGSQIYETVAAHQPASEKQVKREAAALFEKMGFAGGLNIWDRYPFELSGGMNQRAAVAAAMLLKPRLLLADEPTSALDVCARKYVLDELLRLREEWKTAVIIVTHDMDILSKVADTVIVLQKGRIVESGTAAQILQSPSHEYTKKLAAAIPRLERRL